MKLSKDSEEIVSQLREAFYRIPVLEDKKTYLERYIQILAHSTPAFLQTPYPEDLLNKPEVVHSELVALRDKLAEAKTLNSKLHLSTYLKIPDQDLPHILAIKPMYQKVIEILDRAIHALPEELINLTPKSRGRKASNHALGLANSLAINFFELTGNKPTLTVDFMTENNAATGLFIRLVDDVFGILGFQGSQEHYAKQAIAHLKRQRSQIPKKPPN